MAKRTLLLLAPTLGLALTTTSGAAVLVGPLPIPARPPKYCAPDAYRDYEVLVGRAAMVRPVRGCPHPARVRKVSNFTGRIELPINVPVPQPGELPTRIWLFGSHLEYTLDDTFWSTLRLQP